MPFELHADYDRDGKLTASAAEYARRKTAPGAIILPNFDRDGRALPAKVELGKPIDPDYLVASALATDKEPVRIRVIVTPPDDRSGCTLFLRGAGPLGELIRVRDEKLRLIPAGGRKTDFVVPGSALSTELFVETITVAGSPRTDLPDDPNPRRITLELYCQRSGQPAVMVDSGWFEVPQMFVADDLAPAERLYIAQADLEENVPSLRDVERELQGTGVPVTVIPEEANFKDVWVQDQFQSAWCETPSGALRILVHSPRARANAYWVGKSLNLAAIVQSHFPSTDLAVLDDLIDRSFRVRDVVGSLNVISLIDSQHAFLEMGNVFRYRRTLMEIALFIANKLKDPKPVRAKIADLTAAPKIGLLDAHKQIATVIDLLRGAIDQLGKEQPSPDLKAQLDRIKARSADWQKRADQAAPSPRDQVIEIPLDSSKRIQVEAGEADKLFDRLATAHDSLTYGGNIECSPPFGKWPHGKVLIGTSPPGTEGAVDPDVVRLFLSQDVPVVEIDSTWLHVGHIDEFLGFVASSNDSAGFAIVRASAKLGVQLIDAAAGLYLNNLPAAHLHNTFKDNPYRLPRITNDGKAPVTMMLRGKQWLHLHPKEAFEPMEPPEFFKDFSLHAAFGLQDKDWDPDYDRFEPGPLKANYKYEEGRRKYPARMTVLEWQYVDDGSNEAIESSILSPLDAELADHFPGAGILLFPVLFDRIPLLPADDENGKPTRNFVRTAKSFLPNCVNFQTVGDRILIPRPYAPRVQSVDVAEIVRVAFEANEVKTRLPEMTAEYFRRRGLLNSVAWVNSDLDWRFNTLPDHLPTLFRDGFPFGAKIPEIAHKIRVANPGSFSSSGRLKPGWQRLTIPDGTVDIYEAAIQIQLESVGAKPRFVDSWHYHVHGGQIHCGTNVLRKPRLKK